MIAIDGTFIIVFFSFLVFMLMMKGIYFDPMMTIKHEREETIDKGFQLANQAEKRALEIEQTYEKSLAEARRNAQALLQKHREEARAKAAVTLNDARQKALSEIEKRVEELRQSQDSVYQQLEGQKDELARLITEKLSGSTQQKAAASSSGVV